MRGKDDLDMLERMGVSEDLEMQNKKRLSPSSTNSKGPQKILRKGIEMSKYVSQ